MSTKRITVGQAAWTLPDDHPDSLLDDIESTLAEGGALRLAVLDDSGNRVSLFLNGRVAETVVVDLCVGPRPQEISGGGATTLPDPGGSGSGGSDSSGSDSGGSDSSGSGSSDSGSSDSGSGGSGSGGSGTSD
jgi:hypothetical protein